MIQHVNVLTIEGKSVLFRQYGAVQIDQDLLAGFLSAFSGFMKEISQSDIKSTITGNSKFFYSIVEDIIIVLASDIDDKDEEIRPKMQSIMTKFVETYGKLFRERKWNGDRSIFYEFTEFIDKIILGPIKISIIGYGGVGKTTLLRLIVGKEVNLEYIPTITADIASTNDLGKREVVLWDFAGQIQFTDLWNGLLRGTRIVILVTDSSYANVQESKKILTNLIEKYYKNTLTIAIANKQDLSGRLSPKFVEKILNVPTYGMISTNTDYRIIIMEILRKCVNEINKNDGIKDTNIRKLN